MKKGKMVSTIKAIAVALFPMLSITQPAYSHPIEISRLNYLQFSTLHADQIIVGSPRIVKQVKSTERRSSDIMVITPDTIYLEIQNPKALYGAEQKGALSVKLVAFLKEPGFQVQNEMMFFVVNRGSVKFIIDFKKVDKGVFYLESEVVDIDQVEQKGMIGALSINRDWAKFAQAIKVTPFSVQEYVEYIKSIRTNYYLEPYCFHSPIDIGVFYISKNEFTNFKGELGKLNGITKMMVERSEEKKKWLVENATKVPLTDHLCKSILYE